MPQHSPGIASRASRAVGLLGALVATSVGAGLLAAGLVAPGVAAAGSATQGTVQIFNELPAELSEQPLSQQSRILYADGSLMATFYYQNRIVVGLDQMAKPMQDAIIAIEDARFYEHGGVDPQGMGRALAVNVARGGTAQGASTLTQQWIKNVLIDKAVSQLPTSATVEERQAAAKVATESEGAAGYARKLREVKLAVAAEKQLSKQDILARYLNIADFGDGQYGVETASRHYFNKSAVDLSVADSALLAGIVQQPVAFNPLKNPNDSTARRDVVLGRMLALGAIDQPTHDEAVATPLDSQLNVQPTPNGCAMAGNSGWFCDYAVKQLLNDPAFGVDPAERQGKLYGGGLTITTTLDAEKQRAAVETVNARVPNDGSGVAATITSVQPGTGKILAMAQNRTYSTSADAAATETSINYAARKADGGGGGFQPGSNFKPIVLATWLAKGHTLNETVNANEKTFANNSWKFGVCEGSGNGRQTGDPYAPGNAGDGEGRANMPVLTATYNSVNTAYAQMGNQLQLCDIQATATSLGLVQSTSGKPVVPSPSMVLGVATVAPLDVAAAYASFAAQGNFCTPLALAEVVDADGVPVPLSGSTCTQAMSPDVANGVTYALKETLVKGTARGNGLEGRVAAGKTGTTNNFTATWFTGYTPDLATSVWLGFAGESKSLNGVPIGPRSYNPIYGATVSAPTWKEYMDRALTGAPVLGFTDPPGSIIGAAPAPRPERRSGDDRGDDDGGGGGNNGGGGGGAPAPLAPAPTPGGAPFGSPATPQG